MVARKTASTALLSDLLAAAVEHAGSDLHLKVGATPHLRVDGHLAPLDLPALTSADTEHLALSALPEHRVADFEKSGEADFALSVPGVGRFRVNIHRQRGSIGMVLRRVMPGIPDLDQLGLPSVVGSLIDSTRGLVLVSGPAGSGTTTTLAAMVDRLNATRACSIITIEDPVEVLHTDKMGIVYQREIGTDTPSYQSALAHVWRQDPDVVAIGDLRDAETVQAALSLAETGHLVLAAFPTSGVAETLNRILELFPPSRHEQLRTTLGRVLRGVVSQRLLERTDGGGRVPAAELLVCTERVAERIAESDGRLEFDDLIDDGELYGMQTFDMSLFRLCRRGDVDVRDALAAANDPRDLKLSLESAGIKV
jgi:twitching motility protein PilT